MSVDVRIPVTQDRSLAYPRTLRHYSDAPIEPGHDAVSEQRCLPVDIMSYLETTEAGGDATTKVPIHTAFPEQRLNEAQEH